jgi:outer membrane protein TolC
VTRANNKNQGGALRRSACAAAALLALASGSAGAIGLQQAYQAAIKNDPTFRMNFYENEAAKENAVLGRSQLLPSVSAQFSGSKNAADQDTFQFGTWSPSHPHYISRSSVVQLRQPVLNMDAVTRYRQGKVQAKQGEAQDNAVAMRNALAGVIGMDPGSLDSLSGNFRVGDLDIGSFEKWRQLTLERSHELAAGRLAVENARLEITKNKAGHLPRIDVIASYSKGEAESLNTFNQNTVNRSIGVQVVVPIYQGGAINASTRQAAAGYERAKADLDVRTNKILIDLRKAHSIVQSSVHKIEALDKAVASSKELMKATEQSIQGGVRINLDLLNAQQQLFTSQRDLAQARYSYLLGLLRMRAIAGTIGDTDIREIAAYFH